MFDGCGWQTWTLADYRFRVLSVRGEEWVLAHDVTELVTWKQLASRLRQQFHPVVRLEQPRLLGQVEQVDAYSSAVVPRAAVEQTLASTRAVRLEALRRQLEEEGWHTPGGPVARRPWVNALTQMMNLRHVGPTGERFWLFSELATVMFPLEADDRCGGAPGAALERMREALQPDPDRAYDHLCQMDWLPPLRPRGPKVREWWMSAWGVWEFMRQVGSYAVPHEVWNAFQVMGKDLAREARTSLDADIERRTVERVERRARERDERKVRAEIERKVRAELAAEAQPAPPAPEPAATQASPFDAARRTGEDGAEYWSARGLMGLMGYPRWNEFKAAVERAEVSARNIGAYGTEAVFTVIRQKPGEAGGRPSTDYHLSRFAAYLVAMNGDPRKKEVAAALAFFASADPAVRAARSAPPAAVSPLDQARQTDEEGNEYWSARDLMGLMGYGTWQHFVPVLERAETSARNQEVYGSLANFTVARKVSGARGPAQEDYHLSRLATYLVAMNGDPRKKEVAAAQAYFAYMTRAAETGQAPVPASAERLSADQADRLLDMVDAHRTELGEGTHRAVVVSVISRALGADPATLPPAPALPAAGEVA